MDKEKNILDGIGRNSFSAPEGYFEDLKLRLSAIPSTGRSGFGVSEETSLWTRVKPYLALAACFLIAVTVGTAILNKTTPEPDESDAYTEFLLSGVLPSETARDEFYLLEYEDSSLLDSEISEEDIINYLIESGVSYEALAYSE